MRFQTNISYIGICVSIRGFILDRLIPSIPGVSRCISLFFFEQLTLCHEDLLGVAGVAAFRAVVKSDRVPFENAGV